jgi:hypothetical protein
VGGWGEAEFGEGSGQATTGGGGKRAVHSRARLGLEKGEEDLDQQQNEDAGKETDWHGTGARRESNRLGRAWSLASKRSDWGAGPSCRRDHGKTSPREGEQASGRSEQAEAVVE